MSNYRQPARIKALAEKTAGRVSDGNRFVWEIKILPPKRAICCKASRGSRIAKLAVDRPVALPAIISDFAEPTDGKESPWGRAQLVFAYDSKKLPTPPSSATPWRNLLRIIRAGLHFRNHQTLLVCHF